MSIQYVGEHLFPGEVGKFFIWFGFVSAILSTTFYLLAFYRKKNTSIWLRSARISYVSHAFSLITVVFALYYLIFKHYFEYVYVWEYSSIDLPIKYIISCFWAGQEGSFLIWGLWQALIGLILLRIARQWESPVMIVFSFSQVFVTSMLLGVDFLGFKIGTSPFALLRDTVDTVQGTIFALPGYVKMITDGNGLNPLLENFWMTIHPPILFLGYALSLVPFSYAIASFMKKDYYTWVGRAIPWTLFALLMLGAGILLGGAWAYVSLTFGGFWSWDPVENSSLVPWITLVAGLHFLLISRRQNFAMIAAYIMITLSYILVLYASFLTRSGVLANTSAHSFGDNGMTAQLLIYLMAFLILTGIMIGVNFKKVNRFKKEILFSREFWIFIGALVLVLAAFQIIITTSIPVVNHLFHSNIAPPTDRVGIYNRWQIPYVMLIAGFIASCQFLKYDKNEPRLFFRKLLIPLAISIAIIIFLIVGKVIVQLNFIFFAFFLIFALVSILENLFFQTSRPRNIPAIISHLGFIVFILGVLLTFSNSVVISANTSKYDFGDLKTNAENLMLVKGDTLIMDGFHISYIDSCKTGNVTHYQIDFLKKSGRKYIHEFTLNPSVNIHPRMGAVYNPDTRHFIDRDFYAYVSSAVNSSEYVVLKVIMNPYINVLWAGALVLMIGFSWALLRRARHRWLSNN
ncbi:MAG: cytochrome c biogenesis protein CcsA [Bacteroidales bacterium]|nr:cytochrome c biogenesis protein CcsA [Bacteroidales bacterium]